MWCKVQGGAGREEVIVGLGAKSSVGMALILTQTWISGEHHASFCAVKSCYVNGSSILSSRCCEALRVDASDSYKNKVIWFIMGRESGKVTEMG